MLLFVVPFFDKAFVVPELSSELPAGDELQKGFFTLVGAKTAAVCKGVISIEGQTAPRLRSTGSEEEEKPISRLWRKLRRLSLEVLGVMFTSPREFFTGDGGGHSATGADDVTGVTSPKEKGALPLSLWSNLISAAQSRKIEKNLNFVSLTNISNQATRKFNKSNCILINHTDKNL